MAFIYTSTYDDLPDWVDKNALSNCGWGKNYANYLIIEDGEYKKAYGDNMEPEDCKFYRDLSWVAKELQRAYVIIGELQQNYKLMGCPDYVTVNYNLPSHNDVTYWQSKSINGGSCDRYLIDKQGQLFVKDTFEGEEGLAASFHTGLLEIHSYDKDSKPVAFTFTFKDGIVQSVQPGRFYGS